MKITAEVREVLERAVVEGQAVTLAGQLDRKLYTKVNEVLEALGGKWSRKERAHVFADDAAGRVESALLVGEVSTAQDVGFFPTPGALAERMADFVCRLPSQMVLEPSAGDGSLVIPVVQRGCRVTAVEWDPERRAALQRLYDPTEWPAPVRVERVTDFMDAELTQFLCIIANPPFCRVGKGDHVDHLNKMLDLLDGQRGRLACVMPRSIEFRSDKRHVALRERIAARGGRIESLPEGTFKSSGTMVNTSLVLIGDE